MKRDYTVSELAEQLAMHHIEELDREIARLGFDRRAFYEAFVEELIAEGWRPPRKSVPH